MQEQEEEISDTSFKVEEGDAQDPLKSVNSLASLQLGTLDLADSPDLQRFHETTKHKQRKYRNSEHSRDGQDLQVLGKSQGADDDGIERNKDGAKRNTRSSAWKKKALKAMSVKVASIEQTENAHETKFHVIVQRLTKLEAEGEHQWRWRWRDEEE